MSGSRCHEMGHHTQRIGSTESVIMHFKYSNVPVVMIEYDRMNFNMPNFLYYLLLVNNRFLKSRDFNFRLHH